MSGRLRDDEDVADYDDQEDRLWELVARAMGAASQINLSNGNTLTTTVGLEGLTLSEGFSDALARIADATGYVIGWTPDSGVLTLTRTGGAAAAATGAGAALDATVGPQTIQGTATIDAVSTVTAHGEATMDVISQTTLDLQREMLSIMREMYHRQDEWTRGDKLALLALLVAILTAYLGFKPR